MGMVEQRVNDASRLWDAIGEEREAAALHERNMGSLYAPAWGLRVRRSTHLSYAIDISERVATNDLQRLRLVAGAPLVCLPFPGPQRLTRLRELGRTGELDPRLRSR